MKQNRLPLPLVLTIIVAAVVGIISNVASGALPEDWKPNLWLAWPLLAVVLLISIVVAVWERITEQGQGPPIAPSSTAMLTQVAEIQSVGIAANGDAPSDEQALKQHGGVQPLAITPLPSPLTRLIGRESEVVEARRLLLQERVALLTVTGAGGTGKTRLCTEIAQGLQEYFTDGVAFVDLAPTTEPDLVPTKLAESLGIKSVPGQPLLATLSAALHDKNVLLMVDNFEQVTEAAPTITDLLSSCPMLKVLATSRTRLHLRGEWELPLSPLELPGDALASGPKDQIMERALEAPAIQLFVERARAVNPSFAITLDNVSPVTDICRRLDGLPLAIELAAARVGILSPQELLSRLASRLPLLTGGPRDLPKRQRTLRDAIAWSYDLLHEGEQALFRQIAVFIGGCSLSTVEAVCIAPDGSSIDALEGITSLVDSNMLRRLDEVGAESRFAMLETIREFGLGELARHGEKDTTEGRHAAYFLTLAESADPHLNSALADPVGGYWLARLKTEQDNLRAAFSWALAKDSGMALSLARTLSGFWQNLGHGDEARKALDQALEGGADAPIELRIRALDQAAHLAVFYADCDRAVELAEECLRLSRETSQTPDIAQALHMLGGAMRFQGNLDAARDLVQESLVQFRILEDQKNVTWCLISLGMIAMDERKWAEARDLMEQSLALHRLGGHRDGMTKALVDLGFVLHKLGDHEGWRPLLAEALCMLREDERKGYLCWCLHFLGRIEIGEGDLPKAREYIAESLELFREAQDELGVARSLVALGWAASKEERWESAMRLLGAEESVRAEMDLPPPPDWEEEMQFSTSGARQNLGEESFQKAWAEGRSSDWTQAVQLAFQEASTP